MTPQFITILPCHNRAPLLEKALQSLKKFGPPQEQHTLILVADQCTDNSIELTRKVFPTAIIFETPRPLFWSQSLICGEEFARLLNPDYIIWFNEDTFLTKPISWNPDTISVGTLLETNGTERGIYKRKPNTLRFEPNSTGDTFCGNCVVIPRKVYQAIRITPFSHAFSDFDYGLRAFQKGIKLQSMGIVGTTEPNKPTWETEPTFLKRLTASQKPTGLPFSDWWKFCKTHGGRLYPLLFLYPYIKLWKK
jgi:GT2 family glycosyltransferase